MDKIYAKNLTETDLVLSGITIPPLTEVILLDPDDKDTYSFAMLLLYYNWQETLNAIRNGWLGIRVGEEYLNEEAVIVLRGNFVDELFTPKKIGFTSQFDIYYDYRENKLKVKNKINGKTYSVQLTEEE